MSPDTPIILLSPIIGWTVEDVEIALGFPKEWTKIPGCDQDEERLKALRRYGGDEELEQYIEKYGLGL